MTMKCVALDSITGYEDYYGYSVNEAGEVFSVRQSSSGEYKQLKPGYRDKKYPYQFVRLSDNNGNKKQHYIHRIVAAAFIPNPDRFGTVNHINGVKNDNRVCNLEWMTWEDNCYKSSYINGQRIKLTEDQLLYKRYKQLVNNAGKLL